LELGSIALSKLGYYTLTEMNAAGELKAKKNSLGIARFPCGSMAFLYDVA